MRNVVRLGVALAAVGCGAGEPGLQPRTADDAHPCERVSVPLEPAPAPMVTRSVSLGFIGDSRIGVLPTLPHYEPAWTRPFPCHWTGTCWAYPPPGYAPQYTTYVPYPP
jgi:hypothetical protein